MNSVLHKRATEKGILLSNGTIRSLSSEEVNKDRSPSEYPINSAGEKLPSIYLGSLRIPLDVAPEFRYWDERKESESFGFVDVLRYMETPRIVWENYSSRILPETPCCRGCEFFSFLSSNEALGKCSLARNEGVYKADRPVCRVREIEIRDGRSGLPIAKKERFEAEIPTYGEPAPKKDEREPLRKRRKILRRVDRVEEKSPQNAKEKPSSGGIRRRPVAEPEKKRRLKSIEELMKEKSK